MSHRDNKLNTQNVKDENETRIILENGARVPEKSNMNLPKTNNPPLLPALFHYADLDANWF